MKSKSDSGTVATVEAGADTAEVTSAEDTAFFERVKLVKDILEKSRNGDLSSSLLIFSFLFTEEGEITPELIGATEKDIQRIKQIDGRVNEARNCLRENPRAGFYPSGVTEDERGRIISIAREMVGLEEILARCRNGDISRVARLIDSPYPSRMIGASPEELSVFVKQEIERRRVPTV